MLSPKTILHPNDCTKHAENAYHLAASLAKHHGARLILLYVKPPQDILVGEFGTLPTEEEPTDEQYQATLKQLASMNPDLKIDCQVVDGMPVNEILRISKEAKCDLIVLGSHAHSWFGRLMAGDIAEKVANGAKCPVVTLRTPN